MTSSCSLDADTNQLHLTYTQLSNRGKFYHCSELISVSFLSHIMKRCRVALNTGGELRILGVLVISASVEAATLLE